MVTCKPPTSRKCQLWGVAVAKWQLINNNKLINHHFTLAPFMQATMRTLSEHTNGIRCASPTLEQHPKYTANATKPHKRSRNKHCKLKRPPRPCPSNKLPTQTTGATAVRALVLHFQVHRFALSTCLKLLQQKYLQPANATPAFQTVQMQQQEQ